MKVSHCKLIKREKIEVGFSLEQVLESFFVNEQFVLPVTNNGRIIGIAYLKDCLRLSPDESIVKIVKNVSVFNESDTINSLLQKEQDIYPIVEVDKYIGFISKKDAKLYDRLFREISYENEKTLQYYRDLEEEYNMVLESSHDVIHIYDSNGTTLRISKACERIEGIKREEIIGSSMEYLMQKSIYSRLAVKDVIKTRKPVTILQKTKNNKENLATGVPVFKNGELFRVIVNSRDITELSTLKNKLLETERKLDAELKWLRTKQIEEPDIAVADSKMREVFQLAARISQVDSTVLIQGETGVGKGVISKYIHRQSVRKDKPFITIDMSAIPDSLLESELFGYEQGAFTGANTKGKIGLVELAHRGTLFLDEIGDLPINLQAKLLRMIQDKEFYRIGGKQPVSVDVRIIAATHRNLEELVRQNKFREDLYYRLNVVPIEIPPLRERKKDIHPLVVHNLKRFNDKYELSRVIDEEAMAVLLDYDWPGNIRELQNLIERLVVTVEQDRIEKFHLPQNMLNEAVYYPPVLLESGGLTYKELMDEYERSVLLELKKKVNSTKELGKLMGVDASTVRRKFNKLKIPFDFQRKV